MHAGALSENNSYLLQGCPTTVPGNWTLGKRRQWEQDVCTIGGTTRYNSAGVRCKPRRPLLAQQSDECTERRAFPAIGGLHAAKHDLPQERYPVQGGTCDTQEVSRLLHVLSTEGRVLGRRLVEKRRSSLQCVPAKTPGAWPPVSLPPLSPLGR